MEIINYLYPLDLTTIRGRRVLLTVLVLVMSVAYAIRGRYLRKSGQTQQVPVKEVKQWLGHMFVPHAEIGQRGPTKVGYQFTQPQSKTPKAPDEFLSDQSPKTSIQTQDEHLVEMVDTIATDDVVDDSISLDVDATVTTSLTHDQGATNVAADNDKLLNNKVATEEESSVSITDAQTMTEDFDETIIAESTDEDLLPHETIKSTSFEKEDRTTSRWHKVLGITSSSTTSDISEEITSATQEDDIDQSAEITETTPTDPTIMTAEVAQQIEQYNKSQILHQELEQELDYLKKKQKRDVYETTLVGALANDPQHPILIEYLADFYMAHQQQKKALPLYKKLIDQQPSNHIFLWKLAQVYSDIGDWETAEVLLERALTLHPQTPKYAMALVELYYTTNRSHQALTLMEEVIKWRPENMSYWNTLVSLYKQHNAYEKVIQSYEAMLILEPTNVALKRKLLEARTKLDMH